MPIEFDRVFGHGNTTCDNFHKMQKGIICSQESLQAIPSNYFISFFQIKLFNAPQRNLLSMIKLHSIFICEHIMKNRPTFNKSLLEPSINHGRSGLIISQISFVMYLCRALQQAMALVLKVGLH